MKENSLLYMKYGYRNWIHRFNPLDCRTIILKTFKESPNYVRTGCKWRTSCFSPKRGMG